jgi:hypothetical protein
MYLHRLYCLELRYILFLLEDLEHLAVHQLLEPRWVRSVQYDLEYLEFLDYPGFLDFPGFLEFLGFLELQ